MKWIQQITRNIRVLVALHLTALALIILLEATRPYTDPAIMTLLVILVIFSLVFVVTSYGRRCQWAARLYADKTGNAFLDRSRCRALLHSALADVDEDRFKDAFEKLKKLDKKARTPLERRVTRFFMAICYKESGLYPQAIHMYKAALEQQPDYAPALSNLSVICTDMKNYQDAMHYAKQAIHADPHNAYAVNNLAYAYSRLYDLDNARRCALQALHINPGMYPSSTLLACIYAVKEDWATSQKYARKAVETGQNEQAQQEGIDRFVREWQDHVHNDTQIAAWKAMTGRTSLPFALTGIPRKSRIGGIVNETPPAAEDGKPMRLAAAIFCSELPENDLLPLQGVLRFYIPEDGSRQCKVLFDENEEAFVVGTVPYDLDDPFPVKGTCNPRFEKTVQPMTMFDYGFETARQRFMEEEGAWMDDEAFMEAVNYGGCRIGGYPVFAQDDPRKQEKYAAYDTLLLQLDSSRVEGHWQILLGNEGVAQFFISAEDLRQRNFQDVLYTWDSF